jgi:cytochrome o ubiquinol oxidase subunit 1
MPRNTAAGVVIGAFTLAFGFAMIWEIWWLAIVGLIGVIVTLIARTSNDDIHYFVPADEVRRIEEQRAQKPAGGRESMERIS